MSAHGLFCIQHPAWLPSSNINNIFGNWLKKVHKKTKIEFVLEFLLFVRLFGDAEMILFLTNRRELTFCRLFLGLHTGSSYGFFSFRRINGRIWILDATDCWRLLRASIYRLLDADILIGYKMGSLIMCLIFLWLIHVPTLSDPWL
jgi:hypothetical protein